MQLSCKNVILAPQMSTHKLFQSSNRLSPREQLKLMHEFALNDVWRVGILYGLQRTGKSVLLCQWLQSIPYEEQNKTAYISVGSERMVYIMI